MAKPLQILFLSSEASPFAKSGGLADVAGSLPSALKRKGAHVTLVLPFYRTVRKGNFDIHKLIDKMEVPLGTQTLKTDVFETRTEDDIPVYLIEREDLYDRPNLYGNPGCDYYDNVERFSFFSHAALKLAENLSLKPDIVHCHDWQAGLIPALLKGPYKTSPNFSGTSSVFTIHNIGYQGIFPEEKLSLTGLSHLEFFHSEGLEFWGKISFLKSGIVYSDAITTVSPKYAQEIQTTEYGMGMAGILQERRSVLHGIINGVDYGKWDPIHDSQLPSHYSSKNMAGKGLCKEALMKEMSLDLSLKSRPLLGIISRLDAQKGFDLLVEVLDKILALDVTLVVLGSGDKGIQEAINEAAKNYPGRIKFFIGFNEPLAHRIMAGSDIFLLPSRYEPCGLTQMYALRYGTVPVVRATGGLDDTILQFNTKTASGNGFKFGPYDSKAFLTAVKKAVNLFKAKGKWKKLMIKGMGADFSWDRSAKKYLDLYRSLI